MTTIKIQKTNEVKVNGLKHVNYGPSGVGKTSLIKTLPTPLIISAEEGLLSLADENIDFIEIKTIDDLESVHKWIKSSKEAKEYESVAIDSISDLAEVLLNGYLPKYKDARQAYGKMNTELANSIRLFRDLKGYHVYFIAKEKRLVDDTSGLVSFIPSIPGIQMMQNLPYFFDLVTAMRFGPKKEGSVTRYLQTEGDMQYLAKDRSGKLEKKEEPNLSTIINKIIGD